MRTKHLEIQLVKIRHFQPFLLLFFLLAYSPAYTQMTIVETADRAGISAARLERYDGFLKKEIDQAKIPGVVSLIWRKGEMVHLEAFGLSSLEAKAPMRKDGIFHIMSMTKPIISVALMMLYEKGHFFLTDPVSKYLPQFKDLKVTKDPSTGIEGPTEAARGEITIHQLLTHTAGFSHGLGDSKLEEEIRKAMYFEPQESVESRVKTLISLPMIGHPGKQWHYSASPDVLSLLIEHFSGMTTADFLQKELFDPLGMKDTGYNIKPENQERWVPVHHVDEAGKLVQSEEQLPVEGNTVYGGTHGLFSTATDYLNFCQMLLNGGHANGRQFLSPKTIQAMTVNQVGELYQGPGQGFGLGFGITTDVAASKAPGSEGTYYWSGAYCTYFFIDPREELIAILMTQLQPYSGFYGNKLRQMVYQSLTESVD